MKTPITFDELRRTFESGEINKATPSELQAAVGMLANKQIQNPTVVHEALIMADGIHSILLRRLLDEQERRNRKTELYVIILAIASLLSSVVQIVIQLRQ